MTRCVEDIVKDRSQHLAGESLNASPQLPFLIQDETFRRPCDLTTWSGLLVSPASPMRTPRNAVRMLANAPTMPYARGRTRRTRIVQGIQPGWYSPTKWMRFRNSR